MSCFGFYASSSTRKEGYRMSVGKEKQKSGKSTKKNPERRQERESPAAGSPEEPDTTMVEGSFMVASQCERCNNGYRLEQISFSGYDKNQNSDKESFFITNNTDRTLTAISLYVDYATPDGRQLHRRFLKLRCAIPAGETRKADIQTWDTQHSFYYIKSNPSRHVGNSYTVTFDPIAYYLRF